jgi:6-hydroxytryprostatin B O-methyltransferase
LELATIRALTQLGVPDNIPLEKSVPYKELAESVKISPQLLKRMVRYAVLAGFLTEDETGAVGHSAMSAVFLHDPTAGDGFRFMFDVLAAGYSHLYESIRLDPTGSIPKQGPTAVAFSKESDKLADHPTIWEVMNQNHIQRDNFHSMRIAARDNPSRLLKHIANSFDWSLVGTLVDVRCFPCFPLCQN